MIWRGKLSTGGSPKHQPYLENDGLFNDLIFDADGNVLGAMIGSKFILNKGYMKPIW